MEHYSTKVKNSKLNSFIFAKAIIIYKNKLLLKSEKETEGDNMSEYLTYKEACELLHLKSYKGLYYLIKNGLPVIVIGNSKRINANDLKKFMEDHTVTATPKD